MYSTRPLAEMTLLQIGKKDFNFILFIYLAIPVLLYFRTKKRQTWAELTVEKLKQ